MKLPRSNVDTVAVILSFTLLIVLGMVAAASFINTINPNTKLTSTLGENTTQILSASTGAIVGVLGSYMGYRAGERRHRKLAPEDDDE